MSDTGPKSTAVGDAKAEQARMAMVNALLAEGSITRPEVEQAFRSVPREVFVAEGTPVGEAYDSSVSVTVKRDGDGVVISSTSAPFIQARMIEQATLRPGSAVLEIGSGGYNAALLAELVGPTGTVVGVDIDADVVARARATLRQAGYAERVRVLQTDAQGAVPGLDRQVDAVIVTAGAWDLAPAWRSQLAERGRLVVPLRMNGITRSLALQREGERWVSASAEVCGFVAMQGDGTHPERVFQLPQPHGRALHVSFDADPPEVVRSLGSVMRTDLLDVPSGVVIGRQESFADLHLWFACFLPGFCHVDVEDGTGLAPAGGRWFPFGTVVEKGVAHLATRPAKNGGVEFIARGYGVGGDTATAGLVEQIRAWDEHARGPAEPSFTYVPRPSAEPATSGRTARIRTTNGTVLISWPAPASMLSKDVYRSFSTAASGGSNFQEEE